jgi:hypothetical protein
MKLKTLLEMPRIISDNKFSTNLDLDAIKSNKLFYKKLKNRYSKVIKKLDNSNILYSSEKKHEFFVLDNDNISVEYYLKYKFIDISFINKSLIYQSWVWRSNNLLVNGLAKYIYWNHLFNMTNNIITDGLQTKKGKLFWAYRIQEALSKNINVYYVDLHDESSLSKINNNKDFQKIQSELYGNSKFYEDRKIIITNQIL